MARDEISGVAHFAAFLGVFGLLMTAFVIFMAGQSAGAWGGRGDDGAGATAAVPAGVDLEGAQEIFEQRCVTCHGASGHGDGPASSGLNPQPRNFSDPAWQAEVTDEHIERIIVSGGAAVGRSAAMPNNPDLREKPEVVAGLRYIVRGLGGN